jgi:glucosamine--fructose-6-phosphate aminotransferase (isomerizing)
MKRCVKCILHENLPGISFNDAGVCNYCQEYKPFKEYGEEAFREVI